MPKKFPNNRTIMIAEKLRPRQINQQAVSARGGIEASTALSLSNIVALLLWALPVGFYVKGYPLTRKFVACLEELEEGECTPYLEQWEAIEQIGGIPGVLSHIQWGSPSIALYLAATLFLFPLKSIVGNILSQKAGALFNIPAGLSLARCLLAAFQVIGALFSHPDSQGAALVVITLLLVVTTLPFLQLIGWQIEYALRALRNKPGDTALPGWFLAFVSNTNMLRFFVGPLKGFFELDFWPAGYSASGVAAVQSIADADYYSKESNAGALSEEGLSAINAGLLVQMMYGSLAVIPMWAVLTNFGLLPVMRSFSSSRCIWSKVWLKLHPRNWNPAQIGISGLLGPYWILSFGCLLWGVAIHWSSQ